MSSFLYDRLISIYQRLLQRFGPQGWWPAETPFEMMIGAILTQNTSWRQVEKAIRNLKERKCLTIRALDRIPLNDLSEAIRPAGYFNQKADRLKRLAEFMIKRYEGRVENMASQETSQLREALLSLSGIGPETADSILLYALHRPVFVVDTYTYRIFSRQGLIEEEISYADLQSFFTDHLPLEAPLFNEYHALIVREGKEICKKRPECAICPIREGCRWDSTEGPSP